MGPSQVDGSFHSPEWHAARLASLKTSHTITWEEFKTKAKDEIRKGELEADTDRIMMREYRAQLDAERARKLAHGRNHSSGKSSHKKDRNDRDLKKHSSRRRKHSRRRSSESSCSSSPSDSSSDDEERESSRSKSRSKRSKKEKKRKSRTKHSSSDDEEAGGPVPLSRFFGSLKS
ncbi:serine/arginine-rich splicing factor 6-like [Mangifera indica]|uniref:serine/arginine-rich splicing factor 6-like n=1 Tax=Mangifera indica TaxID=29780 RepID=UPI001CFBDCB7|nr:serine/arginine-rich splicing factor 6-like [Mangifera indica]